MIERITDLQNQPRAKVISDISSEVPSYVLEALELLEQASAEDEIKRALELLATSKHPYARQKLIAALDDHRALVRVNAAREIGDLQDKNAIPQLTDALLDDLPLSKAKIAAKYGFLISPLG